MRSKDGLLRSATYGLVSLTLILFLLKSAAFILIPIAWSVFLAISLAPMCAWLENRHFRRGIAVTISIVAVTLVATVIIYVLISQMVGLLENTSVLESNLANYFSDVRSFILDTLGPYGVKDFSSFSLLGALNTNNLSKIISETAGALLILGVVPVYIFFLLYYRGLFYNFLSRVTMKMENKPLLWLKEATSMIQDYLVGLLMVTVIVAIMAGIVFYLLGVEYFLFFALFVAIFNLIPYIGVILSSILSTLYVLLTFDSVWHAVLTLVLLWLIQLIENNVITPLVVGVKVKLNPLAVIIAIMVGGWIWGVSGIILFIPLLGAIKIVFDSVDFLNPYGYLLGIDKSAIDIKEK